MAVNSGTKPVTRIGITGTIGAGKSLAGQILQSLGITVIDTDIVVHKLLAEDAEVKMQIKTEFPTAVSASENGEQINRKELARIIFADKEAKTKLESILHPRVRKICKKETDQLAENESQPKIIATLIPLLFESKQQNNYDQIWSVYCDESILRQRLAKRDGFSNKEIDLRLAGQLPQSEKSRLADKVLDNSKDENHLRAQISKILQDLKLSLPGLNNNLKG